MKFHLAIDIGASSGRAILGSLDENRLNLKEIYRFDDYLQKENGCLCWNVEKLIIEVKRGIEKCAEIGIIPETVAIDTWGVDYVLLDENECEILPVYSYRDGRTAAVIDEVNALISHGELYSRTGIQKQNFNTIYQLYCDKLSGRLQRARRFLMMPDYIAYKLTGVITNEYTNATTTNLVNAQTKAWDEYILNKLGFPLSLFSPLSLPGSKIGELKSFSFSSTVIAAPTHDTASAVAGTPLKDGSVYISSGTWSLIGTENPFPVLSDEALNANFTNEGGVEGRFRFLKNIMGMWLLQSIKRNLSSQCSYDDLMRMAMSAESFELVDTNDPSLVAPESMIAAIEALCGKSMPLGVVVNTVYHSLAASYARAVKEIEKISGKSIDNIIIVGGGSKDKYLNLLTEQYTGKKVLTGPVEATATGNIVSQLIFSAEVKDINCARNLLMC